MEGEATSIGDALSWAITKYLWGIPEKEDLSRVQIGCEGRPMAAASGVD